MTVGVSVVGGKATSSRTGKATWAGRGNGSPASAAGSGCRLHAAEGPRQLVPGEGWYAADAKGNSVPANWGSKNNAPG